MARHDENPKLKDLVEQIYLSGKSIRETKQELESKKISISQSSIRNILKSKGVLRKRGRTLGESRIKSRPSITTEQVLPDADMRIAKLETRLSNLESKIMELCSIILDESVEDTNESDKSDLNLGEDIRDIGKGDFDDYDDIDSEDYYDSDYQDDIFDE